MKLLGLGDNFRDRTTGRVYTVTKMMKENTVMLESNDKTSRVLIA